MTEKTTNEQEPTGAGEDVLKEFTEKLNEFMGQVVVMHNRLNEMEIALAYLLSKDPEWVAQFKKQQSGEQSDGNKEELIEPE